MLPMLVCLLMFIVVFICFDCPEPPHSMTSDDEMCNFYLMYWVEGPVSLKKKDCFTAGPPLWTWGRYLLNNIPSDEASTLD